jgi:glycogen phosphorylase
MAEPPTTFSLEHAPRIPEPLKRLEELAGNLMYSWERRVRALFWRLDEPLWNACSNNPRIFLRRVAQKKLDDAAVDPDFLQEYHAALAAYDIYMSAAGGPRRADDLDPATDLVAYFCAEYGLHESLPIYSGGLGILAGDHCKAASDLRVPLVAVGLLYQQGYFTQQIDGAGNQHALYLPVTPEDLPVTPARGADGAELRVGVPIGSHTVQVRVWLAQVGHIRLVLLDTELPENPPELRGLTHQLYGGGPELRIRQEVVLGIGGVRALRALGLAPTVWHVNEGHPALLLLERIREQVEQGLEFDAALECVAAATVFTTHTPVPAGHDRFPHALVHAVLGPYLKGLGAPEARVLALGEEPGSQSFNMTALALRGSRHANGVSKIHGRIASEMEAYVWPQIAPAENPIRSITNGVHVHSFLARIWALAFHENLREWGKHLNNPAYWAVIDEIPYNRFVAIRQRLKRDLLVNLQQRLRRQHRRNGTSEATLARILRHIRDESSPVLLVGSARRFATYKRATLLLRDRARLARLLNDPEHPAVLVYAGKAHPQDQPGQALIRELYAASLEPDLIGRLIVIEGYDLHFARNLIQGCDVWLNNPEYPLEACGTSGMKAALNGALNLSVLDGWWPEGYDGSNGFAVTPMGPRHDPQTRADEEARQVLDLLETAAPLYYGPQGKGWSDDWIRLSRNAMKTLLPRFNAERMMRDYVEQAYLPALRHGRRLAGNRGAGATELARWKQRVRQHWDGVRLSLPQPAPALVRGGERLRLQAAVHLAGLEPGDVAVECVLGRQDALEGFVPELAAQFRPGVPRDGHALYELDVEPLPGFQHYRVRAYPRHPLQAHPFELGRMIWL